MEEEEVDVVGIQEDEAKDGVVLTLPSRSVQKDTLTIVMQVLDNVLDAVCKMVQCNSDETMTGTIRYSHCINGYYHLCL